MKRLLVGALSVLLLCAGLFFTSQWVNAGISGAAGTVVIYNWGDYIDPELISQFEEEYGYTVVYETYDSNEAMYTKVKQGGTAYDVVVPSEYMISKMISEDLLLPLDYTKLEGVEHLNPNLLNMNYDPGNQYSIPYFWGTLGIVYNQEVLGENAIDSWEDLWSEEYRDSILFIDGAREMMGISLQSQGYSLNSTNEQEIKEASIKLKQLMANAKAIIGDEMKVYMIQGEATIAVTFSGEASQMLDGNEALTYVIPKEGTNLWFDSMVIPKTASNLQGAHDFISFMNRPENAAKNAEYVGYSTANKDALELLPEDVTSDESFYPADEALENMEVYIDMDPVLVGMYNDLYLEAKIFRN